jgi:arsenite-transporting ATPase
VLIASTDPAHSLGDALRARLGPTPRPLGRAGGRLAAVEVDADRALARWLGPRVPILRAIAARGTYLRDGEIDALLRHALPGVDELVGLVEIRRLAATGRYDEVVVDTAPTGHTLRLLETPDILVRLSEVLDLMQAKHRVLLAHLGGRVDGHDPAERLIDEIGRAGRELRELLRDPDRARLAWVLTPEPVVLLEARQAVAALGRAGIPVAEIVVNRVRRAPAGSCRHCRAAAHVERAAIAAIRAAFPGRRLRLVPVTAPEPRGPAALRRLGPRVIGPGVQLAPWRSPAARGAARGVLHQRLERARAPAEGRAATRPARPPRPVPGGSRGHGDGRSTTPPWLASVFPRETRLLIVAGKGGVGKTTCAAALALLRAGESAGPGPLLLSADPAHSVGHVLACAVGDRAVEIPGAPGPLRAREPDPGRALRAWRERYRPGLEALLGVRGARSGIEPAFDRQLARRLLDLAPPGLDELCMLLAVTEALFPDTGAAPPAGAVVLDTAPTGHALRLLGFPAVAGGWLRTLLAILLEYREVAGLGAGARQVLDLARAVRRLEALLRDPRRTRAVVVTTPGALPALETRRLLRRLTRLGIPVSALLVNGVTPEGCARCRRARAAELASVRPLAGGRPSPPRLLAPRVVPWPVGVPALTRWSRTWRAPA